MIHPLYVLFIFMTCCMLQIQCTPSSTDLIYAIEAEGIAGVRHLSDSFWTTQLFGPFPINSYSSFVRRADSCSLYEKFKQKSDCYTYLIYMTTTPVLCEVRSQLIEDHRSLWHDLQFMIQQIDIISSLQRKLNTSLDEICLQRISAEKRTQDDELVQYQKQYIKMMNQEEDYRQNMCRTYEGCILYYESLDSISSSSNLN